MCPGWSYRVITQGCPEGLRLQLMSSMISRGGWLNNGIAQCKSQYKCEHLPHSRIWLLHFTKETFVMPFVFAMVGSHVYFHLAVYMVNLSLQNALHTAPVVDFPQYTTMSCVISQHHYSLRYTMQWEQNLAYSLYQENSLSTKQPMMQMKLV